MNLDDRTCEIWKQVEGYEEFYEVSNLGRVRSKRTGIVLNKINHGNGYEYVSLSVNGVRKNKYIHRLVAGAFCSKEPGKEYVNHKDHNGKNNTADNLEWCTQAENVRYSIRRMRHPKNRYRISNTGEKYISFTKNGYSVTVYNRKCRRFKTLEEAVRFRDLELKEIGGGQWQIKECFLFR